MKDQILAFLKEKVPTAYKAVVAFVAPLLALQLSHLFSLMFHVQIIASPAMVSQLLLSLLVAVPVWWKANRAKAKPVVVTRIIVPGVPSP